MSMEQADMYFRGFESTIYRTGANGEGNGVTPRRGISPRRALRGRSILAHAGGSPSTKAASKFTHFIYMSLSCDTKKHRD